MKKEDDGGLSIRVPDKWGDRVLLWAGGSDPGIAASEVIWNSETSRVDIARDGDMFDIRRPS